MKQRRNTPIKHAIFYTSLLALAIAGCSSDQRSYSDIQQPSDQTGKESQQSQQKPSELESKQQPVPELAVKAKLEQDLSDSVLAEEVAAPTIAHKRQHMGLAKMAAAPAHSYIMPQPAPYPAVADTDRENYLAQDENAIKRVSDDPLSTFSVDVDTAAYSNVRRMIMGEGRLPPSDAVKAEEFINYFNYDYPAPSNLDAPFSVSTEIAASPWNEGKHLLQIGLKGFEPEASERPAANLVFLIDVSGSMNNPQKLGLVKKSLRLLVNQMRPEDRIALTVYAGAAGTVLESTPGNQKAKILTALDNLTAGGSTHGSAGIKLAYQVAQQHFIKGGINRVVIASDGDMNVGTVNHEALKDLIKSKRDKGIALTTLGYGSGNYNYALMEQLADVGNGTAAYIDSLREAQKVLVNEMQSTLLTIARDVKIQVEFNPEQVSEYRLIGYQNRILQHEDFKNDKVDAGDIGAGHTVTALYEIALKDSGAAQLPQLRYQQGKIEKTAGSLSNPELAFVKLRYKKPGSEQESDKSIEVSRAITREQIKPEFNTASDNLKFASAVAGSAQLLSQGHYIGDWNYADALAMARAARGKDPHGYRGEFIALLELAQQLSKNTTAAR